MGTDVQAKSVVVPALADTDYDILTVHTESDRLIAYATMPDHVAFRDDVSGKLSARGTHDQLLGPTSAWG